MLLILYYSLNKRTKLFNLDIEHMLQRCSCIIEFIIKRIYEKRSDAITRWDHYAKVPNVI